MKEAKGAANEERLLDKLQDSLFKVTHAYNAAERTTTAREVLAIIRTVAAESDAPVGALKAIHVSEDTTLNEQAAQRLKQEIDVLNEVHHPSLVQIVDSNAASKWFVMEYFQKGSLDKYLMETSGNVFGTLLRVRPLVAGVAALHREGFVHRDIKPQNIFIADDDRLVLGDCGLVFDTSTSVTRVTLSSEKVGTTDFMPPWAMGGMRLEEVRPSFDVFSLGKIIWCMISGRAVLRLYYHHDTDHPDFDVEKLFPNAPEMAWARRLFEKCIVERERACLSNAVDLLDVIDETIEALRYGAQIPQQNMPLRCRVCGTGYYQPAEGLGGNLNLHCNNCGHIQHFSNIDRRPWWQNKG